MAAVEAVLEVGPAVEAVDMVAAKAGPVVVAVGGRALDRRVGQAPDLLVGQVRDRRDGHQALAHRDGQALDLRDGHHHRDGQAAVDWVLLPDGQAADRVVVGPTVVAMEVANRIRS